jgi:hypothetical protein
VRPDPDADVAEQAALVPAPLDRSSTARNHAAVNRYDERVLATLAHPTLETEPAVGPEPPLDNVIPIRVARHQEKALAPAEDPEGDSEAGHAPEGDDGE